MSKLKYTTQDMRRLAEGIGYKFLSDEYLGITEKHNWMCPFGHQWSATPNQIKNGNRCPKCVRSKPRRTIEDVIKIAKSRGFEFVSDRFIGMRKKQKWRCSDGHVWLATPDNVKRGSGCPKCRSLISEEKTRFIFEQLLLEDFPKNRSILGGLELDGYCEKLSLAFEYNGEQHFKDNHYWNRTYRGWKERDAHKTMMCEMLRITKIDVPYTEDDDLEGYIRKQLQMLNIPLKGRVDWSKFISKPSKLKSLIQLAKSRKGNLLTETFLGSHKKHRWSCYVCQHEWEATAKDVVSGSWCPKCAGVLKYDLSYIRCFAQKNGFEFVSRNYEGMNKKHEFRCLICQGIWSVKPNAIQQGRTCPGCKGR
jgi:thiol-disulfide isomerase/thioredoxin